MAVRLSSPLHFLLLFLTLTLATSEVTLDPGYTVSTVLDCNKPLRGLPTAVAASVHPFAVLPHGLSGEILLLDSTNSAFYSIPLSLSQEVEVGLFSGKGVSGFSDGAPASAMFDCPRSFTIDAGGNVYVADRSNRAIRKIDRYGVTTTIAGGYSDKTGHVDGPAQNASFSNDFDLVFVPKMCSLLISDRGNRLIRKMPLKLEDCEHKIKPGLGVMPVSIIAVLCVLFGSALGFIARPFFVSRETSMNRFISKTRNHFRSNLEIIAAITYSDIRSAIADSVPLALALKLIRSFLCYLSIIIRNIWLENPVRSREQVVLENPVWSREQVLSDSDDNGVMAKSWICADQLKDLIRFEDEDEDGGFVERNVVVDDDSVGKLCKIDEMVRANLSNFTDSSKEQGGGLGGGLSQRRLNRF